MEATPKNLRLRKKILDETQRKRAAKAGCCAWRASPDMPGDELEPGAGEPFPLPIERELDLHTFSPKDIKELVPAYLAACREKGILEVRIVHGKGIGNLRRTVHAILARIPEVSSFATATEAYGGWGATIVHLKP